MQKAKALVGIVLGSDSDLLVMASCAQMLEKLEIPYEITISSAHRSPEKTARYAKTAEKRGIHVIIAAAGMAAHLAGVIAGETTLPIIGVPMQTSNLSSMDSLFSMVQMPSGVPVATVSIGKAGATNAAILAAQILALKYPAINKTVKKYKKDIAKEIERKDAKLQKIGYQNLL